MESLFDMVSQYGWNSVFMIFSICAIYILMKYISNKIENSQEDTLKGMQNIAQNITQAMSLTNVNLIDNISHQQDALINNINDQNNKLIELLVNQKNQDEVQYHGKLFERIDSTETINLKLRDIGHIYKADRVAILEFHNASQGLNGVPFAKYSCNFEWINKGSVSLQAKCQSLPFSMISSIVKDIFKSGKTYIIYDNIDKFIDHNSGLYTVLQEVNAKGLVYSGIYDENNKIVALLVLEYHDKVPKDLDIHNLQIDVESITTILNLTNTK